MVLPRLLGPTLRDSDLVSLEWGLRNDISDKLPGDDDDGDHTLSNIGSTEVPSAITLTSSPLAQIEYVWIRTQCDLFYI